MVVRPAPSSHQCNSFLYGGIKIPPEQVTICAGIQSLFLYFLGALCTKSKNQRKKQGAQWLNLLVTVVKKVITAFAVEFINIDKVNSF